MTEDRALAALIVEDVEDDALLLVRVLSRGGFEVRWKRVQTAAEMTEALAAETWDVVISDYGIPGFGAIAALRVLAERSLDLPFIIVSGVIGEESAVDALRAGAHDYVSKGAWARLVPAVERELREAAGRAERRRAAEALADSERRLRGVMDRVVDAILTLDGDGRVRSANPAADRMLGGTPGDLVGQPLGDLLTEPHRRTYSGLISRWRRGGGEEFLGQTREVVARRADGGPFPIELALSDLELDGEPALIAVARDITERTRAQEQLQHLADHDGLTGLFNRRRFEQELRRQVAAIESFRGGGAVLMLDIDNFKDVNDTLGHAHGDELLRAVARLLRDRFRASDVVARLGGDEFAVLLPAVDASGAAAVADDLLEAVRARSIVLAGQAVRLTTSVGIALLDPEHLAGQEPMMAADVALYQAKEAGRDRHALFVRGQGEHAEMHARMTWSERVRVALDTGMLVPYLQPILDLETGLVSQYEVLMRMVDQDGKEVLPGVFLPTAERVGLIGEIDRYMVRAAIGLISAQAEVGRSLRLEVNLSGRSLADPELPGLIRDELAHAAVDPSSLIFEITETAAIANMDDAGRFANTLRALGCGFALDDFGAGFASFYYLKHLPLDYLKIGGDFIRQLAHSRTDQLVVRAMVTIARGLGLRTVAEWVADAQTVTLLREIGVDLAQGFHIGHPAPAATVLGPEADQPPVASSSEAGQVAPGQDESGSGR